MEMHTDFEFSVCSAGLNGEEVADVEGTKAVLVIAEDGVNAAERA